MAQPPQEVGIAMPAAGAPVHAGMQNGGDQALAQGVMTEAQPATTNPAGPTAIQHTTNVHHAYASAQAQYSQQAAAGAQMTTDISADARVPVSAPSNAGTTQQPAGQYTAAGTPAESIVATTTMTAAPPTASSEQSAAETPPGGANATTASATTTTTTATTSTTATQPTVTFPQQYMQMQQQLTTYLQQIQQRQTVLQQQIAQLAGQPAVQRELQTHLPQLDNQYKRGLQQNLLLQQQMLQYQQIAIHQQQQFQAHQQANNLLPAQLQALQQHNQLYLQTVLNNHITQQNQFNAAPQPATTKSKSKPAAARQTAAQKRAAQQPARPPQALAAAAAATSSSVTAVCT